MAKNGFKGKSPACALCCTTTGTSSAVMPAMNPRLVKIASLLLLPGRRAGVRAGGGQSRPPA
jgi:hypothetical protein